MKKHLVFWALCLCGAPAVGLGYLAGGWLVGTDWARDTGALVALVTMVGAACRYERLNDVFSGFFKRLYRRLPNVGAGAVIDSGRHSAGGDTTGNAPSPGRARRRSRGGAPR